MADNLEQQRIADLFNNAISRDKQANLERDDGKKTEKDVNNRRGAMYALSRFEAANWYPDLLDKAVSEVSTVSVDFMNGRINGNVEDIREVLERYIELVEESTGVPAIPNEMFTARHASWYVARQLTRRGTPMTFAGIDKHIYVTKDLRGQMVGTKSMIFTRQQLDEYVANFDKLPKRGRPELKTE